MDKRVFNAEMLTLARESRGLTQTSLADRLGVTQGKISKIENRIGDPDPDLISRLSSILGYTEDFLYFGESIRGPGSGCVYYRRRRILSHRQLREIIAKINVRRIQMRNYLKSVELNVENRFVKIDVEDSDPARIAQSIRSYWMIPPGPIQNLIRIIESNGGIVIPTDFGTRKVDAISQISPGFPPLFFVNSNSSTDRLRFTLAHEIGHIIMHDIPSESMEEEANLFAAEFLMPAAEIRTHLRDIRLEKLATLKTYWKVSMSALLMRSVNLGLISNQSKNYLWMKMSKYGWRTKEPVDIPPEKATLFYEIIRVHKDDLKYSDQDLTKASYLNDISEMQEILLSEKKGLQLVK